jgi:hypothetical protein
MRVPSGVVSLAELQCVAQVRCAQLHGGEPDMWRVCADWDARHPFLCAAMPRVLSELIDEAWPRRSRVGTLLGRLVQTSVDWPRDGWACVVTSDHATILRFADARLHGLRSFLLPAASTSAEQLEMLASELLREALRWQQPVAGPVSILNLAPSRQLHPDAKADAVRFQWIAPPGAFDMTGLQGVNDASLAAVVASRGVDRGWL